MALRKIMYEVQLTLREPSAASRFQIERQHRARCIVLAQERFERSLRLDCALGTEVVEPMAAERDVPDFVAQDDFEDDRAGLVAGAAQAANHPG